ncbi:MAG: hypothetical protein OEM38_10170 [Gammaproteobacteria bacterium]|nr:hypothetical protein [Gammaproteobacteria bacterium]
MARLMIDDVTPGMILSESVKDSNGQLLLAEDITLTEKHIKEIRMWGIMDIGVQGDSTENEAENIAISPEMIDKAKHLLMPKFSQVNMKSKVMELIFNRAVIELAKENVSALDEA